MRRKSDRKKAKSSPEKKIEKPKRGRSSKRRKRSSSSPENESPDESSPQPKEIIDSSVQSENIVPKMSTPQKEQTMTEEGKLDQVWQVKTAESSGDSGEIQKLKICLTRPAVTPERPDKSPRSRKRLNRNHSQSDTSGTETVDEKRKSRHRSKRSTRESRDTEDGMDERDTPALSVETVATNVTSTVTKVDSVIEVNSVGNTQNDEVSSPSVQDSAKQQLDKQTTDTIEVIHDGEREAANSESVSASTQQSSPVAHIKRLTPEKQIVESTQTEPIQPIKVCEATETLGPPESTVESMQKCDKPQTVPKGNSETVNKLSSTTPRNESNSVEESKIDYKKNKLEKKDMEENESGTVSSNKCDKKPNEASLAHNKQASESKALSPDQTEERQDNQIVVSTSDSQPEETVSQGESVSNHSPAREISDVKETSVNESSVQKSPPNSVIESLPTISSITPDTDMEKSNSVQVSITRKRRWGTRTSKVSKSPVVNISTDSLRNIISDVQPAPLNEVIKEKRPEKVEKPSLPKIVIDNSVPSKPTKGVEKSTTNSTHNALSNLSHRKISIVKEDHNVVARPPSPPKHKSSAILFISNLVRPFTLAQLKNLLQRTGKIMEDGFWIDKIKSRCYVKYDTEDQAVETRHALHGVTWPVSNPKTLQVDFAVQEDLDAARVSEDTVMRTSPIPGTVEDWHRQQDAKKENFREKDEARMWERKNVVREWDMGKGEKEKERPKDMLEPRRRHRTPERSPEPARKFKKKEEEAPAKLLDDLFKKTKTIPCIYWLPLTAETIAIKEEQRRLHMAEHERRLQELRREPQRRRH